MNSNQKQWVLPTIVLVLICTVVTAALSLTYQMTSPVIEKINAEKADLARSEVLPSGSDGGFAKAEVSLEANVVEIYQASNGSGLAFTTVDKGFGGEITVMTGIDASGAITGIRVMKHTETPGLGTKAMTPEYLAQYLGQQAITISGEAGETEIDAITGATITSHAVFRAVDAAVNQFNVMGGVQND